MSADTDLQPVANPSSATMGSSFARAVLVFVVGFGLLLGAALLLAWAAMAT